MLVFYASPPSNQNDAEERARNKSYNVRINGWEIGWKMFLQYLCAVSIYCCWVVSCKNSATPKEAIQSLFTDDNTKHRYVGMLQSMIRMNEERLDTLRKWHRLQTDGPSDMLRSVRDREQAPLVVIITRGDTSTIGGNEFRKSKLFKLKYRPRIQHKRNVLRYSCTRRFVKRCTKACIRAYRNVCSRYHCTDRSRRELRRECKMTCRYEY